MTSELAHTLVWNFCCSIFEDQKRSLKKKVTPMGTNGGVAQLGEHLPCKQGVMGSNPIISTKDEREPMTTGNNGL